MSPEATSSSDRSETRPSTQYWDDPVYHYLTRQHSEATESSDLEEAARLEGLMQELIEGTISDVNYAELIEEARVDKKERKQKRKAESRQSGRRDNKPSTSINVAELKKRVYNHQVTKENMIKALKAMPPADKKSTIDGLPPGLKRKLGSYLK